MYARKPILTGPIPRPSRSLLALRIIVLLATNARRPGNEAKYSPRGKNGGWRAVCVAEWYLIKFMRSLVIFIFIFLPAYRVMFLT